MTHPQGERGAAVVEFVLVAALIALLTAGALQLAYALHIRNTATAHVIEGARAGARADSLPGAGVDRAQQLLATTLPGRGDITLTQDLVEVNGVWVVQVTAQMPLPLLGPWGFPASMTVTGHAFAEDQ